MIKKCNSRTVQFKDKKTIRAKIPSVKICWEPISKELSSLTKPIYKL